MVVMKTCITFLAAVVAAVVLMGCERKIVVVEPPIPPAEKPASKTKTLETSRLGAAVDSYERNSSAANHAAVKKALADLDGEIAELEELVAKRTGEGRAEAAAKLKNLQTYRAAEVMRFTTAQAKAPLSPAEPADARSGAQKIEDTAKDVGKSIEDAARKTGDAVKDAVRDK